MAEEYEEFDFGFSLVGADEVEGSQSEAEERTKVISTQAATAVSKELTDDVKSIISKVNSVLSLVDKDEDDSGWDLKSEQWNRVEEKVDKILTMQSQELATALADQGSSIRAVIDEVEERNPSAQIVKVYSSPKGCPVSSTTANRSPSGSVANPT